MKRYLLLVIAFVCVSIGAWADLAHGYEMKKENIKEWFFDKDSSLGVEKVIKVEVSQAGGLKAALDDLTAILDGTGSMPHQNEIRTELNKVVNRYSTTYSDFIANKKLVLQVVNTSGDALTLDANDLAALESIDIPTIDLQDLNPSAPFTFSNPNVKRVILPDGWDKTAVNAAAEALKTGNSDFESTYSIDGSKGAVVAYVNKPGTLFTAMRHMYGDATVSNLKLAGPNNGEAGGYNFSIGGLTDLTLLGTPSARDFNGGSSEKLKFGTDGHFVFDREADETKTDKDAGIGGTRQLVGDQKDGAIVGAQLARLDLGDAIITDEHCSDLTISWSYSALDTSLKEIIFPTTTDLTTLPADCLNGDYAYLEEFCIPGNIKKLKTRACWISTQVVRHIWTTGTDSNLIYDYGAYTIGEDRINPAVFDHYGHAPLSSTVWNCGCGYNGSTDVPRYGTITLPAGLELIESHCFTSRNISDVYSLNPVAPECHVDAFSTIMYLGNNTIDTQYINEMGMVTREAYAQSVAKGEYISFLHYPRGIGTPQVQRYTDPTREFSVATTMRDGRGNVIYFPNQSELNRAYIQGTTGYLWYAWDSERVPEGSAGNANSFAKANPETSGGHTTQLQQTANDLYIANQMTNPDKTDRSFYDVRLDGDGQLSLEKPGDLQWYYNQYRSGHQLYPEMQSTITDSIVGYVQRVENGHLAYRPSTSGDECDWVQDYSYVKQDDGELVWVRTVSENPNGAKVRDYIVVAAPDGRYYHPLVNRNNQVKPKPWYLRTESFTGCSESEATHVWPQGSNNSGYRVTIEEWNAKKDGELSWAVAAGSYEFCKLVVTYQQNDDSGDYYISSNFAEWSESATDYVANVNPTRFNKEYTEDYRNYNADTDAGETRYDVDDQGLKPYTDYPNSGYDRYHKQYKEYTYRAFDPSKDAADEPRYCPIMDEVYGITKSEFTGDYRGWHQFVLAAYAPYGDPEENTTVKFYQTDSDWWTVCLPYDLRYSEMKLFFGNGDNIPYLSKLRYVVRDYDKRKITLMFSKNLMVYKEAITGDNVHGDIDDETTWTDPELEADPIILHKGVPYLIKPQIPVGANRQFDVAKQQNEDLYQRLVDAENVGGGALETYIYKGEYTVPAYVVGSDPSEQTVTQKTFDHYGDYSKTYYSANPIKYEGEEITAAISDVYSYTFVGSFFLSVLPHDCYFLGWDSQKNRAAFWYNKVPKLDKQEWNNQTGVICANFDREGTLIHHATSLADPARWIFAASSNDSDDLLGIASSAPKNYGMGSGGAITILVDDSENPLAEDFGDQDVLSIDEIQSLDAKGVWYNVNGQKLNGRPTQNGVYIMNGKKYVVK